MTAHYEDGLGVDLLKQNLQKENTGCTGLEKSKKTKKNLTITLSMPELVPRNSQEILTIKSDTPNYRLVTDIGSGINYERKGFKAILEQLIRGDIKKVVVANQDRFTRFSFNLFVWLFSQFGAVVERPVREGEDLIADFIEILTVFVARYYGRRKYYNKKGEVVSDNESETFFLNYVQVLIGFFII